VQEIAATVLVITDILIGGSFFSGTPAGCPIKNDPYAVLPKFLITNDTFSAKFYTHVTQQRYTCWPF